MDIIPKATNPKLNAFEQAQRNLTSSLKDLIDEKNSLITDINTALPQKNKLEEDLKNLKEEQTKVIVSSSILRKELQTERETLNNATRKAEISIKQARDEFTVERENEKKRLAQLLDTLETKEDKLQGEDERIAKLNEELSSKAKGLVGRENLLLKEKEDISGKELVLDRKIGGANSIKRNLDTREEGILDKEKELNEEEKDLKSKLNNFQEVFTNKTAQIEQLTKELEKREMQYKIKFKALHAIEGNLKKREIRLNDRESIFKLNTPR